MNDSAPKDGSSMVLSHYTEKPIKILRSTEQPGRQHGWAAQPKPHGLWVSVDGDDDWVSWCESENFATGDKHHYRIHLARPESILWATDALDVRCISERYDKPMNLSYVRRGHYIDWQRIAAEYAGIVIAPYQWSCGLAEDTHWYYSWDCASGCIWDATAIDRIELLGVRSVKHVPYEERSTGT